MANIFQKAIAKATFWTQGDNQRIAAQDEEEKRKKKQLAAAQAQVRTATPQPGSVIQPNTDAPAAPRLSDRVGSQSQFGTDGKIDFTKPLVPAKKPASTPDEQIEKRTRELLPEKQKQQGESFLDRNLLHRGAGEARATTQARSQAVREYQEKNGYGEQPEVRRAIAKNKEALGKLSEQDASFARNVKTISKGADKVGTAAQYVPVTGSVLNLGLAGADKVTGNKDKDIANTRSKLDFGMTKEEFDQLPKEQRDKLQNIREIGLAASPLDFTGVGGLAKSEAAAATKKAAIQLAKNEAVDVATRQAIKQGVKSTVKKGGVATIAGTGISAGGQQYLTGDVDPLEALKSGAVIGGTSLLVPDKAAKKLNKDVINAADDLTRPDLITAETTSLIAAKSIADGAEAAKESASVPGRSANGAKVPDRPTTEIAPGVKVPSPQEDVDNTPAYQRGVPTTVGEADTQNNLMGSTNLPDSVFDADLRAARTSVDSPEEVALDVPTFMRNRADEDAATAASQLRAADARAELARFELSPEGNFNRKELARRAIVENPSKGRQVAQDLNNPQTEVQNQRLLEQAAVDQAAARQALKDAEEAKAARDTLQIPDPANPIALAPASEGVATPAVLPEGPVMADFSNALDAPLRPIAQDAQGNAPLQSDVQAIESGELNPAATPSVIPQVAPEEQMTRAAAATADEQVQRTGETPAAPRTYDRLMEQVADPNLRAELANEVPGFDSINIADEEASARKLIGSMTNEDLIATYRNGVDVSSPQGFFQAIPILNRLGRSDVLNEFPEARAIVDQITTQVALKKSTAGQTLRSSQVLFENMPPVMKQETLLKSLGKAGEDMADEDRALFLRLIERSDDADQEVAGLQQEAKSLIDDLTNNPGALNGDQAPGFQLRIDELSDKMSRAKEEAGATTADAVKFYDTFKPKAATGSQIADTGRSLMLSGIGGRVFDNLSTAQTAINDVAQSNASAAVGKVINTFAGDGKTVDTFMSPRAIAKGTVQGAKEVVDSFRGKGREDTSLESFTKGGDDANRSGVAGRSGFRGFINNVVDIPTKLTKGIETARQEQLGRQEARQLGLSGDEENMFAQLRSLAPTDEQKHDAVQFHMRTNNLHQNFVTDKLNQFTRMLSASKLGKENPRLAGAVDVLVKNQVAPFISFLGGNLHRAITDKNILYNVVKGAAELKKGNLQGFADQIGNLGVNTTQAMAGGYLLSQMGILTDKDANGNDYGGVYIHLGDRYIPAAILGAASVPVIFGNAVQTSMADGESPEDVITKTLGRAASNTFASAGVASVFGGENNLMQTVDTVARGNGDNVADPLTKYGSALLRQYVNPAIFGDVNAAANNGLPFGVNQNATGMAPQVNATKENEDGREVANVQATEKNRILAGIPGISQAMDRSDEKSAPDLLDRGLKSTRETGEAKSTRQKTESLEDVEKQLKKDKISTKDDDLKAYLNDGDYEKAQRVLDYKIKEEQSADDPSESKIKKLQDQKTQADLGADGVPLTDEGIKARTESGDYDQAMRGLQYQLDKTKDDKNVPASTKKKTEDQLTRLKVASEKSYKPETIALYEKTANAEWRAMGDPDSADYDPDTYALLAQYDADLAANGVSASTKDGKKQKFYNSGGGSGGGGKGKGVSTDIALQRLDSGGFTPIKAKAIDFSNADSPIPKLTPVRNYDQSKKKKITVSSGG